MFNSVSLTSYSYFQPLTTRKAMGVITLKSMKSLSDSKSWTVVRIRPVRFGGLGDIIQPITSVS